jgi:hypothetical protein
MMSNGPPLIYPQNNPIYGGGRSGYVLLQRFYIPFGESVTSSFKIKSYVETVGSPTGSLYISLFNDNASTLNGRPVLSKVLANETLTGVTSSYSWVSASFTGVNLVGGDYYWVGYTASAKGTGASNHFSVDTDQNNVFTDVYTFAASNGFSHAARQIGGSVLWLQSGSQTITVYPYLNQGTNQSGGTAYFEVQSTVKANVITFFVSDRAYDPNNVVLSLEYPNRTILATATFNIATEYGLGGLSYLPLQMSQMVTLHPGIEYQIVAGGLPSTDYYDGSSEVGVTQDYLTETANPSSAGYLGQSQWPVFQLDCMTLEPNGVSNYNYIGDTDLGASPGYVPGSEIALRFRASSAETLSEFQVEVISAPDTSALLQLSLRADNETKGSHPESLKEESALATSSVTLSTLALDMRSGPTTTGTYVLANFTSFSGSTSLTSGDYYWLVLSATKNSYVQLERLVVPQHLVYYSADDYDKTWGVPADGPTDISFNIVMSIQTINNLELGQGRFQLGNGDFAQSFESPSAFQLQGLWVSVNVGGRDADISIRADSGSDSPSTKVLANGVEGQNATGGSVNFVKLDLPVNIIARTKYWIVIEEGACISSCSQGTSIDYNVYAPSAHSSSIDYGGTSLHYETSANGVAWTSPPTSCEGDMIFILAASVSTIKTYDTKALSAEILSDDDQSTSATPEGWNQFLNYEQAQINYKLTQMISTLSGRTFVWFTGLDPNAVEAIPSLNSSYIITQALGAGGGFGCVSQPSCGGVEDYWVGDTNDKLESILSASDKTNVIGWSSFGALRDNVGGVTPEDLSQQYLIELPQLAGTRTLTANDYCLAVSCDGINNFTQTAVMRGFGSILSRMDYTGGYYGTSASTVKILWIWDNSNDRSYPSYLESVANVRLVSDSDSNLTQFGNLQQFNVIVDPGSIQSITASAEHRIIAFVKAGGGIVEDSPPAVWEYNIMGLSPSSGCCSMPYGILAGNPITAPYTSLPGYSSYWGGSFTKESNESAVFDVTDKNGYPIISGNDYYSGRGIFVGMDSARLSYDGIGDDYLILLMNAVLYAAHRATPVLWTPTYSTQSLNDQVIYSVDGSVGHPLLWVSSNSSSNQVIDIDMNAAYFGITGSWVAVNMQDMAVIAAGSGPDIHIQATVKAFDWLPIYILRESPSLNVMYSTLSVKSESNNGQTGTYKVQGARDSSGWLIIKSTSSVTSVSSGLSGALPRQGILAELNQTKIGTFCAKIASSPLGKCTLFTSYSQEGWYYDPVNQLLYIHLRGGSQVSLTVQTSGLVTPPTALTISCNSASLVVGSATKCKATVKGAGSTPTGSVVWSKEGTGSVSFTTTKCILSTGSCTVTLKGSRPGSVTVMGAYSGDSTHQGSSGTIKLTIQKAHTGTAITCSKSTLAVGDRTACTATVTGAYSQHTGTITWTKVAGAGGVTFSSKTCRLIAGRCSVTVQGAAAGRVTIEGTYSGDSYNLRSSGKLVRTVT